MDNVKPTGYKEIKARKSSGAHYTPTDLADFVAKHICKNLASNLDEIIVLDPAVGDGELLSAIARTGKDKISFIGYDIDSAAISEANNRLEKFSTVQINLEERNFLEDYNSTNDKYIKMVDAVIANPPYIRTQVLGAEQSKILAKRYKLSGRVDIYHAFIAKMAEVLKPGGIAGIIVSNRFMYTQGGKSIRELILREFDILHIWDFGDTRLFEAAVLPAVLILKKKSTKLEQSSATFTSIYVDNSSLSDTVNVENIFNSLESDGTISVNGVPYNINTGILHIDDGQPWRISADSRDSWLKTVESNTNCCFEDVSKTKVGVKTTADKVFIKSDWGNECPELLVPLITHHIAERFKASEPIMKILYPYNMDTDKKTPVDINDYKITKNYLLRHKKQLEARKYVIEAGRNWYEIWVPHKPLEWKYPKIVFRDISEKPTFWVDFEGSIVNGDCYWMPFNNVDEKYIWLTLAVANSSFIEKFYDYKFNNKLYSGRRRFISQYVNKFPLPDINTKLSERIITLSNDIYNCTDSNQREEQEHELNILVWKSFGVS